MHHHYTGGLVLSEITTIVERLKIRKLCGLLNKDTLLNNGVSAGSLGSLSAVTDQKNHGIWVNWSSLGLRTGSLDQSETFVGQEVQLAAPPAASCVVKPCNTG